MFSDGFEAETPMLAITTALTNWTVEGNFDVVGMPNIFGITCDGNCVALDGTRGPGAILSKSIAYSAGGTVTISFDLSGSQRSTASDSFNFRLVFDPGLFSTGSEYFLPVFGADCTDNIGPLLDNVLVMQAAIPEPATWAMLIAGFGMLGFAMRRRRLIAA